MAANSVNFFQPGTEANIDIGQIQRQRAIAELLQQQGRTPQQGSMVSGHYVAPGPASYVNQLVSALGGRYKEMQADQSEKQLVAQLAAGRERDATGIAEAMRGTPAAPERTIAPLTPNDDEGNAMPGAVMPAQAASGPDMQKALAIALRSQDPTMRGMAPDLMKRQADAAELQSALAAAGIGSPGGAAGAGGGMPASNGASGPQGGGLPPGVDPQAFALMLSKNPQANKLGGVIQDLAKPQTLAPGGTAWSQRQGAMYTAPMAEPGIQVTNQPGGSQAAVPVANYAETKAAQAEAVARAQERVRAGGAFKTIDIPGIGPVTKTEAQWQQELGGGAQPSPVAPRPQMQPQSTGPVRSPVGPGYAGGSAAAAAGGQAEIMMAELGKAQQELAAAQQRGDAAGAARAQSDMAGIQRELGRLPRGSAPVASGVKLAPGGGIVGQDPASAEYDKTRAKDFAAQAASTQASARQAGGTLRNLDALEQLFKDPNVAAGGAAEGISTLKNMAASTGVDVKGLSAEQGIQAITNKMALEARSTAEGGGMPGAMSDADRGFLASMQPGLSKTPEGRAQIIGAMRAVAQRQVQVAQMANQYEQQNGRLDAGFDKQLAEWSSRNQMFTGQKAAAPATSSAPDFRSLAAQELERRRARK